jgi:hypothetical protein
MPAVLEALGPNLRPRHVQPRRDGPLRLWPRDICGVDIAQAVISGCQNAVSTMEKARADDGRTKLLIAASSNMDIMRVGIKSAYNLLSVNVANSNIINE